MPLFRPFARARPLAARIAALLVITAAGLPGASAAEPPLPPWAQAPTKAQIDALELGALRADFNRLTERFRLVTREPGSRRLYLLVPDYGVPSVL